MFTYGKMAANAVSAAAYLAERYHDGGLRVRSAEIARDRGLSKPLVAKILSTLSTAGLVTGSPGVGGGYRLSRPPSSIRLMEIIPLFEKVTDTLRCPFGADWCGKENPCPLHDGLLRLAEAQHRFFSETTLEVFVRNPKPRRKG